jgi:eukaryotic-like serine/threonine-protein kinase
MDGRPDKLDPREKRFNEVVGAYLEAADAGWAPDQFALIKRYPEFSSELEAFFVAQSHVDGWAYPGPTLARKPSSSTAPTVEGAAESASISSGREPTVGDHVGDYVLEELIAEGGMGKVFKVRQKTANIVVALKMIKAGRLASPTAISAFLREAEAAANLDHPHIVPINYVGVHDGLPYFSMKLFESGSLHNHLPRFENDHRAAAQLLATIAHAVQHAHERGLLHRDLKPGNILLDGDDKPYVADFGLAKFLPTPAVNTEPAERTVPLADPPSAHSESAEMTNADDLRSKTQPRTVTEAVKDTQQGTFLGTKGYAPPENTYVTQGSATVKADVFGLGAILYRMLTGHLLFDAAALNRWQYADAVCKRPAPPPRTKNPKVDERLEAVCLKCLRTAPGDRYATPAELADDLERWLQGEPPRAWKMPWHMRAWRAASRYLLVASLAMCVGFALAALFFMLYYFDPERVPRALAKKAKSGRVTLIGDTGPPEWSRWNVGEGTVMVSPEIDAPYSFTTVDHGRLELLRNAPGPRYWFKAEVKHDKVVNLRGFAGIYFGHSTRATETETKRFWYDVKFAEHGTAAVQYDGPEAGRQYSEVLLTCERLQLPMEVRDRFFPKDVRDVFLSAQELRQAPGWRQLRVKVGSEEIQIFLDDRPLKAVSVAELNASRKSISGGQPVTRDFKFDPNGGLGLYVFSGKASFRNVTVEPFD